MIGTFVELRAKDVKWNRMELNADIVITDVCKIILNFMIFRLYSGWCQLVISNNGDLP